MLMLTGCLEFADELFGIDEPIQRDVPACRWLNYQHAGYGDTHPVGGSDCHTIQWEMIIPCDTCAP